jgi:hypothetical protein
MPGPLSAPNGKANTHKSREPFARIDTGKTALKHGKIQHARKSRPTRAQVERETEPDYGRFIK